MPGASEPPTGAPHATMPLRLAAHAMATRFELVLAGEDGPGLRAVGEAALDEIGLWHDRLSRFEPSSLISHINRTAASRAVPLDYDTFELFSLCGRVWRASEGAFDPTVAPLMERWGVGAGTFGADARVGFGAVRLDHDRRSVAFDSPVSLDLGAVAKGFAIDRAGAILRAHGVGGAFLHAGTSSALAIGAPPGESSWRIAIRGAHAPVVVALRDSALGVSAPRGRGVALDGIEAGHIMDPRAGAPAAGVDTAGVVCGSGAEADAWSTALVVLGARPLAAPPGLASLIESGGEWRITDPLGVVERPTRAGTREYEAA